MKIDWKTFSKSEGYVELKTAVICDCNDTRSLRDGKFSPTGGKGTSECARKFKFVIDQVKRASYLTNLKPWIILDLWESKRGSWYMNYYQKSSMKRLFDILKPLQDRLVLKAD